jgi:hypothetical protein
VSSSAQRLGVIGGDRQRENRVDLRDQTDLLLPRQGGDGRLHPGVELAAYTFITARRSGIGGGVTREPPAAGLGRRLFSQDADGDGHRHGGEHWVTARSPNPSARNGGAGAGPA